MLTEPSNLALDYICINLRDVDAREIYNVRPHDNPIRLAREAAWMLDNMGRGRIAWHNGRPAALIGFVQQWGGMFDVMLFGTDELPKVANRCIRWARRTMADLIVNHGARRFQCDSSLQHTEAQRMLRRAQAIPEGPPLRNYGKDGSDYQRFVWIVGVNDQLIQSFIKDEPMCFAKTPAMPVIEKAPPPPTETEGVIEGTRERQRAALDAQKSGRLSTIKTSARGDTSSSKSYSPTLGGGGD